MLISSDSSRNDRKKEAALSAENKSPYLFGCIPTDSGISRHISNIYKEGELAENTSCAKIAQLAEQGFRGKVEQYVDYYNLTLREVEKTVFRLYTPRPGG